MAKNDGGQAFPRLTGLRAFTVKTHKNGDVYVDKYDAETSGGMSLRDYIAIHASDKDIAPYIDNDGYGSQYTRAGARYKFADVMLGKRGK